MRRFKKIEIWNRDENPYKNTIDTFFKILDQLNISIIANYITEHLEHKLYTYIIEYNDEEFKEEYIDTLLKDFDLFPKRINKSSSNYNIWADPNALY